MTHSVAALTVADGRIMLVSYDKIRKTLQVTQLREKVKIGLI